MKSLLQHDFEQMWQCNGYVMLNMDLGVTFPFGTQNATQLIKDGDEVEVDALRQAQGKQDEGVVRIIKKAD